MDVDRKGAYAKIGDEILSIADRFAPLLPEGTFDEVRHFIWHDEYELAFEALCLELMHHKPTISAEVRDTILHLADDLNSFADPVFDADFEMKLLALLTLSDCNRRSSY